MSDVLRRKMFAVEVAPKDGAMNVGIMSGFAEPEESEYEGPEMEEGDNGEEDDQYEDRRPDNLEIIANNLRGDYKSLDNRYAELAMKVGEEAAAQTPPEVVALMQPQMAQQMQAGIAGLPQGQQVMPGATGAPPMPAAMAEEGMPQMANGGIIQKFQVGGSPAVQALSLGEQLRNAYVGSSGVLPQMTNIPQGAFADFLARSGQYGQQLLQQIAPVAQRVGTPIRNFGQALGPYGRPAVAIGGALTAIPVVQSMVGGKGPQPAASQLSSTAPQTVPMLTPQGSVVTDQGAYDRQAALAGLPEEAPTDINLPEIDFSARPKPAEAAAPAAQTTTPVTPITPAATIADKAAAETGDDEFAKELAIREKRYAAILGGDKDYKQAQALFALADAGLKLASPMKGNLAARIAKAFENVPAAMQKLGAEEEASRRAIKLAAIKGAEEAVASKAKLSSAYAIAMLKQNAKLGDIMVGLRGLGITDPRTLEVVARGVNSGVYKPESDDLGNIKIGPLTIAGGATRDAVSSQTSIKDNPLVLNVTPSKGVVPKAAQKNLLDQKIELEGGLNELNYVENILGDAKIFGPKSFFVSLSNNYLSPIMGDLAPLSNMDAAKKAAVGDMFRSRAARLTALSDKYPVYELKRLANLYEKPESFFSSPEMFIAQVNAARANVMNRISEIDSKLYGTDIIQYRPSPIGASSDPYTLRDTPLLKELFARRPDALVYYRVDKNSPTTLIDRTFLRD